MQPVADQLYVVVGQRCRDCQGEDGPELLGIFTTEPLAEDAANDWWGGTCSRAYVLKGQIHD